MDYREERLTRRTDTVMVITRTNRDIIEALHLSGHGFMALEASDILHRLADYEDTGLTPQEVQRLVDLMKAGRLVEQPVAVGDPVWEIRTNYPKSKYSKLRYDYAIHTQPNRLKLAPTTCYVQSKNCTKSDLKFLGRTVFLTEGEALAAIQEAKENAEHHATE